jgi:surfeit locus 1 family protein
MIQKWPILPTIFVAATVACLMGLGIWQLQRKDQKEALLAQYGAAAGLPAIAYPAVPLRDALPLYRKSSVACIKVIAWRSVSGTNQNGDSGLAHLATCQTGGAEGPGATIAVGWSNRPEAPAWKGGIIEGMIAPDNKQLIKLVATTPVDGLQLLAKPSLAQIPNNHLLYAIQWFFFAAAAAVMYVLAVRKRNAAGGLANPLP